ncbi:MAG: DUF1570 domain-containing protein [Planctomycetota bacterium]|nr:DUF1570 domain-containing protein [Planctomycetota bacterium]MDA1158744.1 DUF1570 domain-containing protein [Planctomycetota bacterium]
MNSKHMLLVAAAIIAAVFPSRNASAAQPMVELRLGDKAVEGRIAERGQGWCTLYDREGKMHTINLSKVTRFKKVASTFAPFSFQTLRTKLLKEFGSDSEVATTRHYVVCAPKGRAKDYCEVFEKTWRRFHMYFSIRGFEMSDPEFPMIAIVLKDRKSFLDYARKENAKVNSSILGYYWSTHNRVIMFEDQKSQAAIFDHEAATEERLLAASFQNADRNGYFGERAQLEDDVWGWAFRKPGTASLLGHYYGLDTYGLDDVASRAGINSDLRETMIHEATHQLGYNLGLHNRTGRNPKWVVEGLATVFETPGLEEFAMDRDVKKRLNPGWHYGLQKFIKDGRPAGFLETFIRDDETFSTQMGNAYAQAWALSFWLIETRPREYAKFLQKMASPEVARQLTPDARVKLFKESFGDNLILLDAEMLRYFARIQ